MWRISRLLLLLFFLVLLPGPLYPQESPFSSVYENLDVIDAKTEALEQALNSAIERLNSTEAKYQQSEETLKAVNQNLQQALTASQELETQARQSEGKLRFWRSTSVTLGLCTVISTGTLILVLKNR